MYSTSSDRCFGIRNSCPSSSVNSCTHYNDVSVVCSKYTYSWKKFVRPNAITVKINQCKKYFCSLLHLPTTTKIIIIVKFIYINFLQ